MAFIPSAFVPTAFLAIPSLMPNVTTQARAGLAIAGLTRAGYFIPNPVILINDVDRTTTIQPASLRIMLTINDEPDTAEFTIVSTSGVVPTAGQTVKIALGDSANLLFAGNILNAAHKFEMDGQSTPWISVQCIDWSRQFNRRRVTYDFSGYTASAAAAAIVAHYTTGFTTRRLDTTQTTVLENFQCINEEPFAALRRVANYIHGGCRIDPNKDVVFWGAAGESGYYVQAPDEITGGQWSLRDFSHTHDTSQWRTRVICEGASARTLIEIPAGANLGTYGFPVDSVGGWAFNPNTASNYARMGAMVVSYAQASLAPGPPAVEVAADRPIGSTSITVAGGSGLLGGGPWWLTTGDSNVPPFVAEAIALGPPDLLGGIPATGYGALTVPLLAGQPLYQLHALQTVAALTPSTAVETKVNLGETVVVRAQVDDAAAQAAIAAIEGGDGIHEHVISDSSLKWDGCLQRAQVELDTFSDTLPVAVWETEDMNALPGALQAINITQTGGLVETVVILRVTLTFPVHNWRPRRVCEGGLVKLQGVFDQI